MKSGVVWNKYFKIFSIIIVFAAIFFSPCNGQTENNDQTNSSRLKLYLDCDDCDFTYFRKNLSFVNFVRDQKLGDLHLLVTEQRTASGGRLYKFNFIGMGDYANLNYVLETATTESNTDLQTWDKLLNITQIGLMPFISHTDEINKFSIDYYSEEMSSESISKDYDPWNYWVFRLRLGSDFELEESQKEYKMNGRISVDRITDQLKFRSDLMLFQSTETYITVDTTLIGKRNFMDADIEVVYSLGPRWSAGFFNKFQSSSYQNTDFSSRTGLAIEYNIFPWDKSDRRIFTFAYHAQLHHFDYRQITIYNKLEETLMSQSLRLSLIMRQPWGEIESRLEGLHYFQDFSKNRLKLDSEYSVNVTKGLAVFAELDAALIRDQLYLPAGEVTREELLLRQQQLQTSYKFNIEFGFRITFGSIYNNIVNHRL